MLKFARGDIFKAACDVYVNPVNCEGVSGSGLALIFKHRFPENYKEYREWCIRGGMLPGRVFTTKVSGVAYPKYIMNAATKDLFRYKSTLTWVEGCVKQIAEMCPEDASTIAVPALGCGKGNLSFEKVRPIFEEQFSTHSRLKVAVFLPHDPF